MTSRFRILLASLAGVALCTLGVLAFLVVTQNPHDRPSRYYWSYCDSLHQTTSQLKLRFCAFPTGFSNDNSIAAYKNLVLYYLAKGELDSAEEAISDALSLAPEDSKLVILKGRLAEAKSDYAAASAAYLKGFKSNPESWITLQKLGDVLRALNDQQYALKVFEDVKKYASPNDDWVDVLHMGLLAHFGDSEEASLLAKQIVAEHNQDVELLLGIVRTCQGTGLVCPAIEPADSPIFHDASCRGGVISAKHANIAEIVSASNASEHRNEFLTAAWSSLAKAYTQSLSQFSGNATALTAAELIYRHTQLECLQAKIARLDTSYRNTDQYRQFSELLPRTFRENVLAIASRVVDQSSTQQSKR